MFDEIEQLRNDRHLFALLAHYEAVAVDREAWQDRLGEIEGVEPREMTRLHGELIAQGWIEQNTGNTPHVRRGVVASCYRIAVPGVRALKKARRRCDEDEDAEPLAA
jgi:hypothetical protein